MGKKSKVSMISNADVELLAQYICSNNTSTKKETLLSIKRILNKLAKKDETNYDVIYSFCEPVKEGITSSR